MLPAAAHVSEPPAVLQSTALALPMIEITINSENIRGAELSRELSLKHRGIICFKNPKVKSKNTKKSPAKIENEEQPAPDAVL
jgi:hypothetical protein